jgi:hypothetical protein
MAKKARKKKSEAEVAEIEADRMAAHGENVVEFTTDVGSERVSEEEAFNVEPMNEVAEALDIAAGARRGKRKGRGEFRLLSPTKLYRNARGGAAGAARRKWEAV